MSDPSSLVELNQSQSNVVDVPPPQIGGLKDSGLKDVSQEKLGEEALELNKPREEEIDIDKEKEKDTEIKLPEVKDNDVKVEEDDKKQTITLPKPGAPFQFRSLANQLKKLDAQAVKDALPSALDYHTPGNIHALVVLFSLGLIDGTYLSNHAPLGNDAAGAFLFGLYEYINYAEYNGAALALLALFDENKLKAGALTLDNFRINNNFQAITNPVVSGYKDVLQRALSGALKIENLIKESLAATITSDNLTMLGIFQRSNRPLKPSDVSGLVVNQGNVPAILDAAKKVNDLGLQITMQSVFSHLSKEQKVLIIENTPPEHTNTIQSFAAGGTWKEAAQEVAQKNPKPSLHLKTILTGLSLGIRIHMPEGPDDKMKETTGKNSPHVYRENALDRMAEVLPLLPESHVAKNPSLGEFVREKEMTKKSRFLSWGASKIGASSAGGVFYGGNKTLGMEYNNNSLSKPSKSDNMTDKGDVLRNVKNEFNATLRHEVGHAVDDAMGLSRTYCTLPEGGGWKEYPEDNAALIEDLWAEGGGESAVAKTIVKLQEKAKLNARIATLVVKEAMRLYIDGTKDINAAFLAAAQAKSTSYQPTARELKFGVSEFEKSKLFKVIKVCSDPEASWQEGEPNLNGKRFQASYGKTSWVRYNAEARNRKVSKYQFRAPGEWIAEAYAAYYEPTKNDKSNKLRQADPVTWAFFKTQVDTDIAGKHLQTSDVQSDVAAIVQAKNDKKLDQHVQEVLNPPDLDESSDTDTVDPSKK